MALIRIKRTSEYINKLRNIDIFIDGKKVGKIANGEIKDFPTSTGNHKLLAKIDWGTSPEIIVNLKENQLINLELGTFKYGKHLAPISIGLIPLHYILKYLFDINYSIILLVPFFLLLVYYLTIGRKKYLTLKQINIY